MRTCKTSSGTPIQAARLTPLARALAYAIVGGAMATAAHAQTATPQPAVGQERPEAVLPSLTVKAKADKETATGPVNGYAAKRSATGSKTDTPVIETPQSITVVGAEQIEVLKPQSLTEALGYSAGVFRSEDVDATRDQMRVRGFDLDAEYGSYFRDGLKYSVNGFNGQQEPYGLERIELLRGAASVLYGLSAPGGLVNSVSKRPTTEPLRELNIELGSFKRKQVSGDFGGRLTADGAWSYRLTALRRNSDTAVDFIPNNRTFIAPALKWQPDAATSLTLLSEYQHDRSAYRGGLPLRGTIYPNVNGQIPRNRFLGDPNFDKYDNTRYTLGYLFEHAFNNALTLRNSLRYFHSSNDYANIGVDRDLGADDRTLTYRDAGYRFDKSSAVTADTSLQLRWSQGRIQHTSLVGIDVSRSRHQSDRYEGEAPLIDVYAPRYGQALGPFTPWPYSSKTTSKRYGIYAQDQMKIAEQWVLNIGGRQDWVSSDRCSLAMPSLCPTKDEKSDAFTGKLGLVYLAGNGLAPFVSFSQAWEPVSGVDGAGKRLKPTQGEQIEAGVRFQPSGGDLSFSAAVYQLTRQNVVVYDPNGDPLQVGEQRSRGVELEATGRVARNLNIIAAYAYTDARNTRAGALPSAQDGSRTGGVPYHQASLWFDYALGEFGLPGLKLGAGTRYVGSSIGLFDASLITPSYSVIDAMASYTTGPWRLALNISNLADKTYLAMCPYSCSYGEPRKVIGTVSYRW